jgi:hypothetical protein
MTGIRKVMRMLKGMLFLAIYQSAINNILLKEEEARQKHAFFFYNKTELSSI